MLQKALEYIDNNGRSIIFHEGDTVHIHTTTNLWYHYKIKNICDGYITIRCEDKDGACANISFGDITSLKKSAT